MLKPVVDLEKILCEQKRVCQRIYDIEERKSNAITGHDGKLLEKLSLEQEGLLSIMSQLENQRLQEIDNYRKINRLDDIAEGLTLKDIVLSMDEDSSHHLFKYGVELKKILTKISKLHRNNEKLIRDNMEFFNLLISGIKSNSAVNAGYDSEGKEEESTKNSILFNQTA
ncbi:flagellar export chaperone FlgN [Spirochaetota bacterium]